ncbi:MAG: rhomboid family intramembrane serine protease [Verrucomicrobia bacterium]|nr:rhomboid family intramembrane serine protease [Verrucomicrobiota bacterium]
MREPLAICTVLIIAVTVASSFQGFRSPAFLERFIFNPAAILRDKEYFRLVTSAFLHADWQHLGFNALSLYLFGRHLEMFFGFWTLLQIYFGAILGGGLLSLFLHRHHEYRALGASGGVCGVIFASIFLLPGGSLFVFPVPFPIPSWLYAIVFIVASFVGLRRQRDNIGHDAHLGGAIIGLLIATALYPSIVPANLSLYLAVMGLTAGLFAYLWINPLWLPAANPLKPLSEWVGETKDQLERDRQLLEDQEMDRLLEKISRAGMDSLNAAERKRLEAISKRKRTRT